MRPAHVQEGPAARTVRRGDEGREVVHVAVRRAGGEARLPRRRGGHVAHAPGREAAVRAPGGELLDAVGRGEDHPLQPVELERRRQGNDPEQRRDDRAEAAGKLGRQHLREGLRLPLRPGEKQRPRVGHGGSVRSRGRRPPLRRGRAGVTCGPHPAQRWRKACTAPAPSSGSRAAATTPPSRWCARVPGRPGGEILASVVEGQDRLHAEWGGVVPEIAARAHAERLDLVTAAALDARRPRPRPHRRGGGDRRSGADRRGARRGDVRQGDRRRPRPAALRRQPPRRACADPAADRGRRLSLPHAPRLRRALPVPRRRGAGALPPPRGHDRRRPRRGLRQGREAPRPRAGRRSRRSRRRRRPATPAASPCRARSSTAKGATSPSPASRPRCAGPATGWSRRRAGSPAPTAPTSAPASRPPWPRPWPRRPAAPSGPSAPRIPAPRRCWPWPAASPPTRAIRAALAATAAGEGAAFLAPPLALCTDNGAVIAWAAAERMAVRGPDDLALPARPRWPLDSAAPPMLGRGRKGAKA